MTFAPPASPDAGATGGSGEAKKVVMPSCGRCRTFICLAVLVAVATFACSPAPEIPPPPPDLIVAATRAQIGAGNELRAQHLVEDHRRVYGMTPQSFVAYSWLGRGALAANRLPAAERYGRTTYQETMAALEHRGLDDEPDVPLALSAAIEVLGQAAAARGARSEAVSYLTSELDKYRGTSMEKRIQKNLNLITLTGTPTPTLDLSEFLTDQRLEWADLQGKVVVFFFWAHWCADCKIQGPILADLIRDYSADELAVIAPTQRFGYVAGGMTAPPDIERTYIADVFRQFYPGLMSVPVPMSEGNHITYGVSTTPTLVIAGRDGLILTYHPGTMTRAALDAIIRPAL